MIPSKINKLLFSGDATDVFKGMGTLFLGGGTAKLISLACIPLLTRIYSPADFGLLSIFTALAAVLAPFLSLRYVQAIPLPRTDSLAANIFALSAALIGVTSLLLSLLAYLVGGYILRAVSMDALVPWMWLIVLGCVGSAIHETWSMWATRKKDYRTIAKTQFTQSLMGVSIKLLLGILGLKPFGLLLGHFASLSSGGASYWFRFRQDVKQQAGNISWRRMQSAARLYAGYPSFRLPSQVLLIFSSQAPALLTATFYDTQTTGQLGLALTALALPTNLLGDSMSKAFYGEISRVGKRQPDLVRRISYSVIRRLLWMSLAPALALAVGGEWLFTHLFGSEWSQAGQFAAVLAIYLVFQFIQKPVSYLMFVFDGQKTLLYLNTQRAAITIASFVVGQWLGLSAVMTVTLYAVSLSVHYVFSIVLAIQKIPASA